MIKIRKQIILTLSLAILVLAVCSAAAAAETPNHSTSMQMQGQSSVNHNSNATNPTQTSVTNTKPVQTSTVDQPSKESSTDTGSAQTNSTDQPSNVVISGQVKKCSDGSPFEGVTVTAEKNGAELASTTTGADGTYSLEFPGNSGVYNVTASYPGHDPSTKEVTVNPDSNGTFQGRTDFQLAPGDDIFVSPSGNDANDGLTPATPKRTIQAGINAVNPNGTVHLANGTYSDPLDRGITIDRNVNIVGESQTGTIIDAGGADRIFANPGFTVTLQDLTFTNGNVPDNGGAINNSGDMTVNDCTFINNTAQGAGFGDGGGAIFNSNTGTLNVNGCTFTGNDALNANGGAIDNQGTLTVMNSIFGGPNVGDSNTALNGNGGAIDNSLGGTSTVSNSIFTGNSAGSGGAIGSFTGGDLTITGSTFTNNSASIEGGAIWNPSSTLIVDNSDFTGNSASSGGAIGIDTGNGNVTGSTFENNTAVAGGAIFNGVGTLTANSNDFVGNSATDGGAILNGGTSTISSNNFLGNSATDVGGAIWNLGTTTAHFNRIVGNTPSNSEVHNELGTTDATLNWWGSNSSPAGKVSNGVEGTPVLFDPWLVLSIFANPTTIFNGGTSTVTSDLQHDSKGVFHDPALGHVPDGIPITLTVDWGSFTNLGITHSITSGTVNGGVAAIFFANEGPTPSSPLNPVLVTATADDQTVSTFITILNPSVPSVPPTPPAILSPIAIINAALVNTQAQAQTSTNTNNNDSANINIIDPINYVGNIFVLSTGNNIQIQAINLLKVFGI